MGHVGIVARILDDPGTARPSRNSASARREIAPSRRAAGGSSPDRESGPLPEPHRRRAPPPRRRRRWSSRGAAAWLLSIAIESILAKPSQMTKFCASANGVWRRAALIDSARLELPDFETGTSGSSAPAPATPVCCPRWPCTLSPGRTPSSTTRLSIHAYCARAAGRLLYDYAGKRGGRPSPSQPDISARMIALARERKAGSSPKRGRPLRVRPRRRGGVGARRGRNPVSHRARDHGGYRRPCLCRNPGHPS